MQTFQRGFFCSDLTLRYPYHECKISVAMLLVCMLLLPMLSISIMEIMRICKRFRSRDYMYNLWRSLATFSFGFIATYLTTELAKNVTGRLRPHFYDACQPRLHDGTTCEQLLHAAHHHAPIHSQAQPPANTDIYLEHYYCANRNLSARQLSELHVSFPSAHASLAFFSMVFLAFYVHTVWRGRGMLRVLRHILQFVLIMIAWYIALSRVADYWHHWSDVLAGAVLGITYAVLTAVYVGEFLRSRVANLPQAQPLLVSATKATAREEHFICNLSDDDMKAADAN